MTEINLLPWREARREQERKNVITLLIFSVIIAVVVVFLINQYASGLVDEQAHRNQRLQDEITRLNAQLIEIKRLKVVRDGLISRMTIVHSLLSGRITTIHLFDELAKIMPDGIYLTEMKRVGDLVSIQGYSESNSNVSILMKNIQNNPWLYNAILTDIKKNGDINNPNNPNNTSTSTNSEKSEFNLSFTLRSKTADVKLR